MLEEIKRILKAKLRYKFLLKYILLNEEQISVEFNGGYYELILC